MNMDKIIELIAIAEAGGNFEKSFRLHMEAAERGNVVAMAMVARMYELGLGTEQNIHEALMRSTPKIVLKCYLMRGDKLCQVIQNGQRLNARKVPTTRFVGQ